VTKSEVATQQFRYGPMPRPERPCINFGEAGRVGGDAVIRFRRFCLLPRARQLLADGQPIELGSRAFDLLVVLLKGRGNLVTKDEIVRHVWPSTMVDECNLRAQMATLRKVLGKDRDVVKTVPGLGYVFSVEAAAGAAGQSVATPPGAEPASPAGLPAPGSLRRPWLRRNFRASTLSRPSSSSMMIGTYERHCTVFSDRLVYALSCSPRFRSSLAVPARPLPGVSSSTCGCPGKMGWTFTRTLSQRTRDCLSSSSAGSPMSRCRSAR